MSFTIVTDTSANLPTPLLAANHITVIPFHYTINGKEYCCLDTETFDGASYYAAIKAGTVVSTSQIAPQAFVDHVGPILARGEDVLFISMSSGISGSYQSAVIASEQLAEEFPERKLLLVDTLAASLGEGISVLNAVRYREQGLTIEETARRLLDRRKKTAQLVLLDDLMYLRRGGRLTGSAAIVGTLLGIKPILKGNSQGQLVVIGKIRGRKQGIAALAKRYAAQVKDPEQQTAYIVYTDTPDDAEAMAELIRKGENAPKEVKTLLYEPVTGSYLGPGAIALFFEGDETVREL